MTRWAAHGGIVSEPDSLSTPAQRWRSPILAADDYLPLISVYPGV